MVFILHFISRFYDRFPEMDVYKYFNIPRIKGFLKDFWSPVLHMELIQLSSVQSLSHVQLFATHELQHTRPPCPSPTPGVCRWRSSRCSRLWPPSPRSLCPPRTCASAPPRARGPPSAEAVAGTAGVSRASAAARRSWTITCTASSAWRSSRSTSTPATPTTVRSSSPRALFRGAGPSSAGARPGGASDEGDPGWLAVRTAGLHLPDHCDQSFLD